MRSIALNDLLRDENPDASFHDALVEGYYFNARSRSLALYAQVDLYSPTGEPRYRAGVLTFSEVLSFHVEAPDTYFSSPPSGGLWLTSDGPVDTLTRERTAAPALQEPLPDRAFHHYLYFSDANSFMFVAALRVEFAWREVVDQRRGDAV